MAPSTAPDRTSLTADAWAAAALDAISHRGLEGVAVEPLARELGVTKGSFYWHFSSREALLQRALALWEQQETDDVLRQVAHETDPRRRIESLIGRINASKRASRIYQALSSAAHDPVIAACVRRVSERRMRFLLDCYRALGLSDHDARLWARMTYSVYLGTLQIRRDLPDEWPAADEPAFADYVQFLMGALIPPESADDGAPERDNHNGGPGAEEPAPTANRAARAAPDS
ncbi:transcriptional regulator [Salinisphaera sp. PC39]|uniref:TetR/AcrR family transcriptional regulator n=1 Tax=Salinisphaera sp. PC39 TaxID=1304156 RepID=UPI00333FC6CE